MSDLRIRYILVTLLVTLLFLATGLGVSYSGKAAAQGTLTLGELPVGSKVADNSWEWEYRTGYNYSGTGATRSVIWIVVARDHYGEDSGVTLLAEELIGYYPFDRNGAILSWGSNHWGNSGKQAEATHGLLPWLNSTGIHAGEGFYNVFSESFKDNILPASLPNREWEDGSPYSAENYVFIPSTAELGDTDYNSTYAIGSVFPYFEEAQAEKRIAWFTEELKFSWYYWTRSPDSTSDANVRLVDLAGDFYSEDATLGDIGVRPALNMKPDVRVSGIPDASGVYLIGEEVTLPPLPVPPAVRMRAPNNRAVVAGSRITFRWWPLEEATRYQIQIRRVSNNSIFRNATVRGGDSFRRPLPNFPNDGTRFRWRVRAYNEAGWGPWSSYRIFTNGRR